KLTGQAVRVADGVASVQESLSGGFAASADGSVLTFQTAASSTSVLSWFDRAGKPLGVLGPPADYRMPRISPDGNRVAFARTEPGSTALDLWYMDATRGTAGRLSLNPTNDWYPVWSPDGRRIVFSSDRDGKAMNT